MLTLTVTRLVEALVRGADAYDHARDAVNEFINALAESAEDEATFGADERAELTAITDLLVVECNYYDEHGRWRFDAP